MSNIGLETTEDGIVIRVGEGRDGITYKLAWRELAPHLLDEIERLSTPAAAASVVLEEWRKVEGEKAAKYDAYLTAGGQRYATWRPTFSKAWVEAVAAGTERAPAN